jgi:hypothetical protein
MGITLFLQTPAVTDGGRVLSRMREARTRLEPPQRDQFRGRAWINGREVGGPDSRFAHLARSYD